MIQNTKIQINYERVPEHMRSGIRRYIEEGEPVGHFLTALLSNDLSGAVAHGDLINQAALVDWVKFLHNEAPSGAHGSLDNVRSWSKAGGLRGMGYDV
jgi:hypothetical protein